jgi:glucose-1-phosphate thymidylyltransferase
MVKIDKNNNIICHVDKPKKTNLRLLWGNACWSKSFTELLAEHIKKAAGTRGKKEIILGDVFDYALRKKMTVKGLIFKNGSYIDIGTYEELKTALKKYA